MHLQPSGQAAAKTSRFNLMDGMQGKEGICICLTKQAILIAHYGGDVQPGAAANTVERLGDYLIGVGY